MSNETMKAWVIDKFGGPEVYRVAELPIPTPGEGEVLVKVQGSSFNPADWKVREGHFGPREFPLVQLFDVSGIVVSTGAGVTEFGEGDAVYGVTYTGAAAEYAVVKADHLGPRPTLMDPADAAVVPVAALTAYQALFDHGQVTSGQKVLIHAGAGGVGSFAIQLAKWAGAFVYATGSARNHHLMRELGADECIDYHSAKFEEVAKDVDMVLHSIGQDQVSASLQALKPGGRLVAISADPLASEAEAQGKVAIGFSMVPATEQLRKLEGLIQDLIVRPVVDTVVPFDRFVDAMNEVQQGHTVGKIGLRI